MSGRKTSVPDKLPLPECWQGDVARLKKLKKQGKAAALEKLIEESRQRVAGRLDRIPVIDFPAELPVSQRVDELAEVIERHQVVVVCGETGSGKSTQLPKLLLKMGRGTRGLIAHTQPRRVAARTIAKRLSDELGTDLGKEVGFKIRFRDQVSSDTYIKVLTDGMLLAEIQGDRSLDQYDTIIIDEAHERSLNIDFLLGYLKQLLPKRPDLKVIITSATIDPDSFSEHFDKAPIVQVSGRTYPVDTWYRPLAGDNGEADPDRDMTGAIVDAVAECWKHGPGDALVFLSGEREIRETAEALKKRFGEHAEVLPLFSRLAASDQDRVFNPGHKRRIVLATNVAETSITVPRISYVIDPGVARISRYSAKSKVQRLPIERISQASANQRKGRCGRISDGICVRLYSEEDFESRPEFTDPEIQRTNLAAVILQMQLLKLGEIEKFPFLAPPNERLVSDGYRTLQEIEAVDEQRRITSLGRELARLPADPRLGRVLLAARDSNCLKEIMTIVAVMAIQDPRERPMDKAGAADEAHAQFNDDESDFIALVNLWNAWQQVQKDRSGNQARKWCKQHFLAYMRMREWQDIRRQLSAHFSTEHAKINQADSDYSEIHRALLSGFISQVALRDEGGWYDAARGLRVRIFPGSAVFKAGKKDKQGQGKGKGPKWILAGELVETGKMWARKVARVEPAWIEAAGAHLVKREVFEPHWEAASGRVAGFEKKTLFGLPIVAKRRINFGPENPKVARELFIREGLVRLELEGSHGFLAHNRELLELGEDLEARVRRRDILVEESALEALYAERLPDHIYDGITFKAWYRKQRDEADRMLSFSREEVLAKSPDEISAEQFPDALPLAGTKLPLDYHFDPSAQAQQADGISLDVPVELLGQLDESALDWLVPGFIEEKVTALIRGLPKARRRNFVPAPDFAREAVRAMSFGEGDLLESLARQLTRMSGAPVDPEWFRDIELPPHLRMNLRLRGPDGEVLAEGQDLESLQERHEKTATQVARKLEVEEWPERHDTRWSFGERPEQLQLPSAGRTITVFPTLEDREHSVASTLAASEGQAAELMHGAVLRLLEFGLKDELRFARRNIDGFEQMALQFKPVGSATALQDDILEAAQLILLGEQAESLRNEADYRELEDEIRAGLQGEVNELADAVSRILGKRHQLAKQLSGSLAPAMLAASADVGSQLDRLVFPGFVARTPRDRLMEMPRYLEAARLRLERAGNNPQRDLQQQRLIEPHENRLLDCWEPEDWLNDDDPLARYRWLIEEYRVSLFAQELGTRDKVSEKRLSEAWRAVQRR